MKYKYSQAIKFLSVIILLTTVCTFLFLSTTTDNRIKVGSAKADVELKKGNPQSHMLSRVTAPDGPGSIPSDWMDRQRSYPHGKIKTESFLTAMRQAHQMHTEASRAGEVVWELAGPRNIGGRISDIEMPEGSNSIIYVGAASGGIFKTTNNGASWAQLFKASATLPIGDLAIDPDNSNVIWAGTGEANASSQSVRGDGIYKSTDAGLTWTNMGLEQTAYFGRIIVDHSNSNRVFAAACGNLFTPDGNRGIYRTTNGGTSWERILFINDSVSGIDIVQHPTNANILYAAMWERMRGLNYRRSFGPGSGLWKSTDGGDNWTQLTDGLPLGDEIGRIGLAISPSSPNILYAFYDNMWEVAVYRTNNSGSSWSRTNDGAIQGINSSFGWYFGQIRVHPTNPDVAYVQGVDLYYTNSGGSSWTQLAGYYNMDEIHVDRHAMHINPNTGRILEGNDGGLYFSDDAGFSWTKMNNLPITQFYDIEVDYLNPDRIYGGTQDNNTVRTWTGGLDDWEAILGGDGFYCLVDYTNSNIIYAESQWGGLAKSTNGGSYMYDITAWGGDRVNWSAPIVMHPADPDILYFGTYRVYKSTNGGESWQVTSSDLTDGDDGSSFHTVTTLAISPVQPNNVLAGTDDGNVYISTNSGTAWTNISAGLPDRWITRVAFDPFEAQTIYVTCSGFRWDETTPHIFKSTDLGQSWVNISGNMPELPVNCFIADPTREDRYFAGTDGGVFWTKNGGLEWESLNGNLGNVPVISMKIHQGENFLLIGTYGLSAYKLDLAQLTVGTRNLITNSGSLRINSVYPQPFDPSNGTLNIDITASATANASITIVNMNGREVFRISNFSISKGTTTFRWDGTDDSGNHVQPGVYLIEISNGKERAAGKLLVN